MIINNEEGLTFSFFFESLISKRNISYTNQIGITGLSLKTKNYKMLKQIDFLSKTSLNEKNLDIHHILVVKQSGELIIQVNFHNNNLEINNIILSIIKNLSHNFIKKKSENFVMIKLSHDLLITILISNLMFVCISKSSLGNPRSKTMKLFLHFFSVSFYNFIGADNEIITDKKIQNIQTNYSVKIFEMFFALPLVKKFEQVIFHLQEEVLNFNTNNPNINNIEDPQKINIILQKAKKKNIYLFNYRTKELLLDLRKIMKKKNNCKLYLNKAIFTNLLCLAEKLASTFTKGVYINDNTDIFREKYITCELLSTYPRQFFVIKFFAIHNGYILIEQYYIYRLSKDHGLCHEIEERFPSEIYLEQNSTINFNFQFPLFPLKIAESDLHIDLENFLIEYFVSVNSAISIFISHTTELKYFNKEMIMTLLKLISNSRSSFEDLVANFNKILACYQPNNDKKEKKKDFLEMDYTFIVNEVNKDKNSFLDEKELMVSDNVINGMEENLIVDESKVSKIEEDTFTNEVLDNSGVNEFNFLFKKKACEELINSIYSSDKPQGKRKFSLNVRDFNLVHDRLNMLETKLNLLKELQLKLKYFNSDGMNNVNIIYSKRKSLNIFSRGKLFGLNEAKRQNSLLFKEKNDFITISEYYGDKVSDKNSEESN